MNRGQLVFVDTNAILEAHRTRSWRALSGGYRLITTEQCISETQSGQQYRQTRECIDATDLRNRLHEIHFASIEDRAEFRLRTDGIELDLGEESLLTCRRNKKAIGFIAVQTKRA